MDWYWKLEHHASEVATEIIAIQCNGEIQSGPFLGMHYVEKAIGSKLIPKLLGCYECELWPVMELICTQSTLNIIDVGAAEGYYAVGLLFRMPSTRCFAFESQESGRELMAALARKNSVDNRLTIGGHCTIEKLSDTLRLCGGKALVIMDVEGGEIELMDPFAAKDLLNCEILVELHDFLRVGCEETIRKRFSPTHLIEKITSDAQSLPRQVKIKGVSSYRLKRILRERPVQMSWLHMRPMLRS